MNRIYSLLVTLAIVAVTVTPEVIEGCRPLRRLFGALFGC